MNVRRTALSINLRAWWAAQIIFSWDWELRAQTLTDQRLQEIDLRKRRKLMLFKNSYRKSKGLIKSPRGNKQLQGRNRREQWTSRERLRPRPFMKRKCDLSSNEISSPLCKVQLRVKERAKPRTQPEPEKYIQHHHLLVFQLPFPIVTWKNRSPVELLLAFSVAQTLWWCRKQAERIPIYSFRMTKTRKCWITLMQAKKERTKSRAKR